MTSIEAWNRLFEQYGVLVRIAAQAAFFLGAVGQFVDGPPEDPGDRL